MRADFHRAWLRHSPGHPDSHRPAGPKGRFGAHTPGTDILQASVSSNGELELIWSDQQVSRHNAQWLLDNRYGGDVFAAKRRPVALWRGESPTAHRPFSYQGVRNDDNARLELFEHMLDQGAILLRGAPTTENAVLSIANWFGHVPANLYSDDPAQPQIGNVRVDPSVSVATNMCHFLGPHTDTCWRQTLSGLVLLHCLESHPNGGRSIVVDGFAVAEQLRNENPEAFSLLANVPLEFGSKVDDRDDWRVMGRVLSVSGDGTLEGIRYNGNSIGQLELPADLIESTYAALEAFESILYDQSMWWQPMLQAGDVLLVDNHRVLHGREAFDPKAGKRHLQTCAVDRDDFHNTYRRLARQKKANNASSRLAAGVI